MNVNKITTSETSPHIGAQVMLGQEVAPFSGKIPTFTSSQTITKVPLTQHPFGISYLLTLVEFKCCRLIRKTYQSERE